MCHHHSQECFGRQGDHMIGPLCGFAEIASESDTRLIAAAPDLLAALKDAVQTARNYYAMFHDETWKERLAKWDAAIAKAEGAQR